MAEQVASQELEVDTMVANPTPIQNDISKMEAAIASLQAAGKDLFSDEIAALQAKLIKAKKKVVSDVQTVEASFAKKYGQAVAHGIEIVLLGVIAGRVLGVL